MEDTQEKAVTTEGTADGTQDEEQFDLDDYLSGDTEVEVQHKDRSTFHLFRAATAEEYILYQRKLAGIGNNGKQSDQAFVWLYDKLCKKAEIQKDETTRIPIEDYKAKVPIAIKMHAVLAFNAQTYALSSGRQKN